MRHPARPTCRQLIVAALRGDPDGSAASGAGGDKARDRPQGRIEDDRRTGCRQGDVVARARGWDRVAKR